MPWIIERKHPNVAVVTMNTNKVNAQNPAFFTDLHAAFDRLESEFADCAVVLTGTGAVFTAGLDFDHHFPMFARRSIKEIDAWFDEYRATNLRLFTYPRPTVAAINGHAYAGGFITAIDCDHRIASEGSLQFALNEVPIGIPMPAVYCEIIKYAIGTQSASELTLFGQIYDLAAATRMGAVQQTVAPDRLIDAAVAWAALVPPDCYTAYAFAKRALQATTLVAIDVAARLDRDLLSRGMSDLGSIRAHTRRYKELKGRDVTWPLPA
ncbi:enoyl-CoA hydratase/isomerase family protein [Bradyrhizobium erythrophlei]|uniref:enoyl-CoA hydratase/isomerase family protein n=1 Tax=Bradyrhizobium erythrophlei TaxID=1437360 RepID=UPI0035EC9180